MTEPKPVDLSWAGIRDLVDALTMAMPVKSYDGTHMEPERAAHVVRLYPTHQHAEVSCDEVRAELARRRDERHGRSLALIRNTSTRGLLRLLDCTRRCGGWWTDGDGHDRNAIVVSYDDLKAELATREHVPGRLEARELRRAAATEHHGPKKHKLSGGDA